MLGLTEHPQNNDYHTNDETSKFFEQKGVIDGQGEAKCEEEVPDNQFYRFFLGFQLNFGL